MLVVSGSELGGEGIPFLILQSGIEISGSLIVKFSRGSSEPFYTPINLREAQMF